MRAERILGSNFKTRELGSRRCHTRNGRAGLLLLVIELARPRHASTITAALGRRAGEAVAVDEH